MNSPEKKAPLSDYARLDAEDLRMPIDAPLKIQARYGDVFFDLEAHYARQLLRRSS